MSHQNILAMRPDLIFLCCILLLFLYIGWKIFLLLFASGQRAWSSRSTKKFQNIKREEFEKTTWLRGNNEPILYNPAADPDCETCKGFGAVEGDLMVFWRDFINCPDCWKVKKSNFLGQNVAKEV